MTHTSKAQDHIRLFTLTGEVLHLYEMTGDAFQAMQGRVERLATTERTYWRDATAWQITEAGLENLHRKHTLTEIPPVVFHPSGGINRNPTDYREGMVRFTFSLLGYHNFRTIPGPWRRTKPIGDLHWPVDVSDLWEHPERFRRPEIVQEHERRMLVISDTLKARAFQEYFQLRHAPQTEAHVFYTYQLAMDRTMGYFKQHGIELDPVTFGFTLPPAPPIAQIIPVEPRRVVLVVFKDGGVARVDAEPTTTEALERCTYNLKGEKKVLDRVLLTEKQAGQISRVLDRLAGEQGKQHRQKKPVHPKRQAK